MILSGMHNRNGTEYGKNDRDRKRTGNLAGRL